MLAQATTLEMMLQRQPSVFVGFVAGAVVVGGMVAGVGKELLVKKLPWTSGTKCALEGAQVVELREHINDQKRHMESHEKVAQACDKLAESQVVTSIALKTITEVLKRMDDRTEQIRLEQARSDRGAK